MNKFDTIYNSVVNEQRLDEIDFKKILFKLLQSNEYKIISHEIVKAVSHFEDHQRNEKLEILIKRLKDKRVVNNIIKIFKDKRNINVTQNNMIKITQYLLDNGKERNELIQKVYDEEVNNYVAQEIFQELLV